VEIIGRPEEIALIILFLLGRKKDRTKEDPRISSTTSRRRNKRGTLSPSFYVPSFVEEKEKGAGVFLL